MISVVIPTYNRKATIMRALQSVLEQTYSDIEVLIIDDGSTDGTKELFEDFKNSKVKYIYLEDNQGACRARNIGIKEAKGAYIAFLDSDDFWDKNKLEIQKQKIENGNYDMVFCKHSINTRNGKIIYRPNQEVEIATIYDQLLYQNFITTGAILGKSEVLKKELFDERLPQYQDWELVLRLCRKYKVNYCEEVLLHLIFQKNSISNITKPEKSRTALEIIYEKNRMAYQKNLSAYRHLMWNLGMLSLYTNNHEMHRIKEGADSLKRKFIYILLKLGMKNQIKELYKKR